MHVTKYVDNTTETPLLQDLRVALMASDQWYRNYLETVKTEQLSESIPFVFTDGDKGGMSREEMLIHCWSCPWIDPVADTRLPHLKACKNPAQTMIHEKSDWGSEISATGSSLQRRGHNGQRDAVGPALSVLTSDFDFAPDHRLDADQVSAFAT